MRRRIGLLVSLVALLALGGGALVRSTVTGPTFTQSFTAPSTGKSIVSRSPFPVITDYTGGGDEGTLAVARATGLVFMLQPGVMYTGRQVFEAVVVDHTPEGIPILGDAKLISQSGNFFSGDIAPLICAALSGP